MIGSINKYFKPLLTEIKILKSKLRTRYETAIDKNKAGVIQVINKLRIKNNGIKCLNERLLAVIFMDLITQNPVLKFCIHNSFKFDLQ